MSFILSFDVGFYLFTYHSYKFPFLNKAFAINNNSQVLGIDVGNSEALIWENNQMSLLGPETFFTYDNNNKGEVIGALLGNIGNISLVPNQPMAFLQDDKLLI